MRGGAARAVDDANKVEYAERRFRRAMLDEARVAAPLGCLLRGFYDVVPLRALVAAGFDAGERARARILTTTTVVVVTGTTSPHKTEKTTRRSV